MARWEGVKERARAQCAWKAVREGVRAQADAAAAWQPNQQFAVIEMLLRPA